MSKPKVSVKAAELVNAERQDDYGHPLTNHERIASIWNVVLGPKLTKPITPREVCLCMIGVKLSREVNKPKHDNIMDIAGYCNCIEEIDAVTEANEKNKQQG